MSEGRSGAILLQSYDKFADAAEFDLDTHKFRRIERPEGHGWACGEFVVRVGRLHVLLRHEQSLLYVCGKRVWNVGDAKVQRRIVWPFRFLTFSNSRGVIGRCAWPDWEIARRWFIPSDGGLDEDDFDWSKLIRNAFAEAGRRDRIFPPTQIDE